MKSIDTVVREVLARHSHREADDIVPSLHLQHDLRLRPLELALVALDLEEIADIEVPFREIASMNTVGELLSLFSAVMSSAPSARHNSSA